MNNVLAISVALKKVSIAAKIADTIVADNINEDMPSCFVATVNSFCAKCGLSLSSDIHTLLVASGPGSFTGLRIAMSFAKAVKCSSNTVVIPVNYFNVLEYIAEQNNINTPIMAVNSENSNEFFIKYQGQSASVKKVEELQNLDVRSNVICEAGNPITLKAAQSSLHIVNDLRNAAQLFHAANLVTDKRLEPFYVKPPYTCKS